MMSMVCTFIGFCEMNLEVKSDELRTIKSEIAHFFPSFAHSLSDEKIFGESSCGFIRKHGQSAQDTIPLNYFYLKKPASG